MAMKVYYHISFTEPYIFIACVLSYWLRDEILALILKVVEGSSGKNR